MCNQHTLFESPNYGVGRSGRGNFGGPGPGDRGKKNETKDKPNYVISGLAFAGEGSSVWDSFTPGAGRVVGVSDSRNDPQERANYQNEQLGQVIVLPAPPIVLLPLIPSGGSTTSQSRYDYYLTDHIRTHGMVVMT